MRANAAPKISSTQQAVRQPVPVMIDIPDTIKKSHIKIEIEDHPVQNTSSENDSPVSFGSYKSKHQEELDNL